MEDGKTWHQFLLYYYRHGQIINELLGQSENFMIVKQFVESFETKGYKQIKTEYALSKGRADLMIFKGKKAILIDWKCSKDPIYKLKKRYECQILEYMVDDFIEEAHIYNPILNESCEIIRPLKQDQQQQFVQTEMLQLKPQYTRQEILELTPDYLLSQPFRIGHTAKYKHFRDQTVSYAYTQIALSDPSYLQTVNRIIKSAAKENFTYSLDMLFGARQYYEYHQRAIEKEGKKVKAEKDYIKMLMKENEQLRTKVKDLEAFIDTLLAERDNYSTPIESNVNNPANQTGKIEQFNGEPSQILGQAQEDNEKEKTASKTQKIEQFNGEPQDNEKEKTASKTQKIEQFNGEPQDNEKEKTASTTQKIEQFNGEPQDNEKEKTASKTQQ